MLSWQTKVLWAKKAKGNQDKQWLPLVVHMSDAAEIARLLWRDWLPYCTKKKIALGIYKSKELTADFENLALPCFVFLAAAHDLGKATPAFQSKPRCTEFDEQLRQQMIDAGLSIINDTHSRETRHFWASQVILEEHNFFRELAVILGGHHGQPPDNTQLYNLRTAYRKELGWNKGQEVWVKTQQQLLEYALELAGVSEYEAHLWQPDITAQVLLSGLVIMVDWIVSNEMYFPYIDLSGSVKLSIQRAESAWGELSLPECWNPGNAWMGINFFKKRFDFEPRPVQSALLQLLVKASNSGIVILEAPMGEGKTEAALAAAELIANRTKRSGVFFALPTQASANGLFLRICSWVESLEDGIDHAVQLAHGKANLNELYNTIKEATKENGGFWVGGEESEETGDDAIIVHEWFSSRKKGILADFVIGTIDQVLMGSLKQKHLALRHLGLTNKVVILDECHAYDAYMSQYLYKVLNWLGAYDVPVIVLSATLPGDKRRQLVEAYLNKECTTMPEYDPLFDKEKLEIPSSPKWSTTYDYPIITYTDGCEVLQENVCGKQRSLNVAIKVLPNDDKIISVLEDLLSDGGCAGIIVNTVKRAQKIAFEIRQHFGEEYVQLLHSRFISKDRAEKEKELFKKLGADGDRPKRCIIIGTQIFEQSCDLDFDVLISDICPMDLLIQRIGRLHRHDRKLNRPPKLYQAHCYISGMFDYGFDRGSELIYGKYLLMNTRSLLPAHILLPDDIPLLVQKTYNPDGVSVSKDLQEEYIKAKNKHEQRIAKKAIKSKKFQISDPYTRIDNLVGWLDLGITNDPSGKRGEATVRDTDESLEVIVVQKRNNEYFLLPWLKEYKGQKIPVDRPPETGLARLMVECSIQLPRELCWNIDETIRELESISLRELWAWQQSDWLKGELFLVLDEHLDAELCGYQLHYDQSYGMISTKIGEEDINEWEKI